MKVKLRSEISGSRDGQPWPPPGSEVDLPQDEAVALLQSGSAVPVNQKDADVELRSGVAAGVDPATEAVVQAATTTNDRTTQSKRAHEPLNAALADDEQPDEADNGPRADEVPPTEPAIATPSDNKVDPTPAKKAASGSHSRSTKK